MHKDYRKVDTMGQYLMHPGRRGSGGEWSKAAGQVEQCVCIRMKTRNIKSDTNPEKRDSFFSPRADILRHKGENSVLRVCG